MSDSVHLGTGGSTSSTQYDAGFVHAVRERTQISSSNSEWGSQRDMDQALLLRPISQEYGEHLQWGTDTPAASICSYRLKQTKMYLFLKLINKIQGDNYFKFYISLNY